MAKYTDKYTIVTDSSNGSLTSEYDLFERPSKGFIFVNTMFYVCLTLSIYLAIRAMFIIGNL